MGCPGCIRRGRRVFPGGRGTRVDDRAPHIPRGVACMPTPPRPVAWRRGSAPPPPPGTVPQSWAASLRGTRALLRMRRPAANSGSWAALLPDRRQQKGEGGGGGGGGRGPRGLVASLSGGKGGGGGSVGRGAPGVRSSLARRPGVARTLRRVASPRPPESLTARADITHRAGEQRGRGSSVGTVHGRTGAEVGCGTAAAARHSDSGSKAKSQTAIRSLACCEGIRRERENRL
jgi:hypothetical protein